VDLQPHRVGADFSQQPDATGHANPEPGDRRIQQHPEPRPQQFQCEPGDQAVACECLPPRWQATRGVEYAQYGNRVAVHSVGNEVTSLENNQFARARYSARPTHAGFLGKLAYCFKHSFDDGSRSQRIVKRNVTGFVVKISQRRAQPPNSHGLAISKRGQLRPDH